MRSVAPPAVVNDCVDTAGSLAPVPGAGRRNKRRAVSGEGSGSTLPQFSRRRPRTRRSTARLCRRCRPQAGHGGAHRTMSTSSSMVAVGRGVVAAATVAVDVGVVVVCIRCAGCSMGARRRRRARGSRRRAVDEGRSRRRGGGRARSGTWSPFVLEDFVPAALVELSVLQRGDADQACGEDGDTDAAFGAGRRRPIGPLVDGLCVGEVHGCLLPGGRRCAERRLRRRHGGATPRPKGVRVHIGRTPSDPPRRSTVGTRRGVGWRAGAERHRLRRGFAAGGSASAGRGRLVPVRTLGPRGEARVSVASRKNRSECFGPRPRPGLPPDIAVCRALCQARRDLGDWVRRFDAHRGRGLRHGGLCSSGRDVGVGEPGRPTAGGKWRTGQAAESIAA